MTFTSEYLAETIAALHGVDTEQIERCVGMLAELREAHGRLFVLGNGGSAANASHAVNDFRKLCGIEAYAPTDNVAELTARTNDDGWHTTFNRWLQTSRLTKSDMLLVLSVGGGHSGASQNIEEALGYANKVGAPIIAIVGRSSARPRRYARECIVVPEVAAERVTPHAEEAQSIVCHLFVSHPKLRCSR